MSEQTGFFEDKKASIITAYKRDMQALMNDIAGGVVATPKDMYRRKEIILARSWQNLAWEEGHRFGQPKMPNNSTSLEVKALNMRARIREDEGMTEREIKRRMALSPKDYNARVEWLMRNRCRDGGAYLVREGTGGKAKLFSSEKAQRKYYADRAQASLDLRREISLGGIDQRKTEA